MRTKSGGSVRPDEKGAGGPAATSRRRPAESAGRAPRLRAGGQPSGPADMRSGCAFGHVERLVGLRDHALRRGGRAALAAALDRERRVPLAEHRVAAGLLGEHVGLAVAAGDARRGVPAARRAGCAPSRASITRTLPRRERRVGRAGRRARRARASSTRRPSRADRRRAAGRRPRRAPSPRSRPRRRSRRRRARAACRRRARRDLRRRSRSPRPTAAGAAFAATGKDERARRPATSPASDLRAHQRFSPSSELGSRGTSDSRPRRGGRSRRRPCSSRC